MRWPLITSESSVAPGSADITAGTSSSSGTSSAATPLAPAAAPAPLRSHPVVFGQGPGQASWRRSAAGAGRSTPEIVPEHSEVNLTAVSGPVPVVSAQVKRRRSTDTPSRRRLGTASAFATTGHLSSVPSGDMGMSNAVAHIGQLDVGAGERETVSMFSWPWAAVSETAQEEGPALRQKLSSAPADAVAAGGHRGEVPADGAAKRAAKRGSVREATGGDGVGGEEGGAAARRASWWGRDSAAVVGALQRGAQAVRATVRFATGVGSDGSESEEDAAATEVVPGGSGGPSGSMYNTRSRKVAADDEVTDMAVLCGWCDAPGCSQLTAHGSV